MTAADPLLLEGTATVPEDEELLDGHYPGFPIVPGMVLLEHVDALVRRAGHTSGLALTGVDRCRFRTAVRGGEALTLRATLSGPDGSGGVRCAAEVRSGDVPVATLKLHYTRPEVG